ncbi:Glutathione S-transferase L1 [Sesamum angolense]|uniref:Glutathione S-transferase L1 n=1 Tax=Sesamum angolense TaxID=2727404 RepID=A0AAE1W341_9LAMI|nr:Glutathione S-transferase L1 [Sesamum angolense]
MLLLWLQKCEKTLPPALDSSSDPPAIFDGTPTLYISYSCPYAQRAWITRNCKGLQETIKLVPIDLKNRPAWYKEKVHPENKVPSLEHNNEVKGESLDLIWYIDSNFEGPSLYPDDPAKRDFGEELLDYTGSFYKAVTTSFKESRMDEAVSAFDHIETALSKFDDGPFFLGKFSFVSFHQAFADCWNSFGDLKLLDCNDTTVAIYFRWTLPTFLLLNDFRPSFPK